MRKCLLLLFAFAASVSTLLAQEAVRFGQYTVVPEQNVTQRMRAGAQNALAAITPAGGKVNVLMQFKKAPDAMALRQLAAAGVVLEGYVGGNAYYAQVAQGKRPSDFAKHSATSVIAMRPEWKVSSLLEVGRVPAWADRGNGRVAVTLSWFSNVDGAFVKDYVSSHGYALQSLSDRFAQAEVEMPLDKIHSIAAEPWVCRLKPVDPPQELNNNYGRVLGGGSYLSVPSSLGGRGLTGRGVRVGLWDGNVENHVDFGNRLHVLEFESSIQESGGHGIHTAGTIAGAGLLNAKARGIAPAVELYAMNFGMQSNGLMVAEEVQELYQKYNIALTSNSYGYAMRRLCAHYEKLSYSFVGAFNTDLLSEWYPDMTHVYAAGNDQGECGKDYGSSTSRSKNAIYVGAVDANGKMSTFSSWGPMDDGRLIPTVSAKGVATLSTVANNGYEAMNGTSMACPTVTGLTALLTERYHQLNGGQHMNSALVKGVLANTADDKGNVGPDYQYGYGIVNATAAVKVIENGWYRNDTVVNGTPVAPFKIAVPAGVKQLRVMLTWIDPAIDKEYAYGAPALINDLDLSVLVGGTAVQPWVLDPTQPEAKATRGIDAINNIEQVVVDLPAAGDAIVTVGGHDKIKEGEKQGYTLTWYFEYGDPVLLSPVGGELFSPGEKILLRADNLEGETKAEISYDGGKSYKYMGMVSSLYSSFMTLPKDAKTTRDARIRLSDSKGNVLVNAHPFIIAGQPQNLKYSATTCSLDSWKLTWDVVEGATQYAVMKADVPAGTWKEIAESATAEYAIPSNQIEIGGRNVYAVAVKMGDGQYGPRSLGVLVAQPTPVTVAAADLPYEETFVTLPLVGGTIDAGASLSLQYGETPAAVGLPLGSRMVAAKVKIGSGKALFEDPANVLSVRVCKMDLSGVAVGTHLVFRAIGLMSQTKKANGAQMRLRANGNLVKLTMGQDSYAATGKVAEMYWDLRDYAGQADVQLELQYACHEKDCALILLGFSILEAAQEPEVGLYVSEKAVPPKVNMGVEALPVLVYSGSEKAVESVPVVVLLDGKVAASAVVKDLKPYEEREITIPVDFSTDEADGHIFKVEVRSTVEGDKDPRNNSASIEVYNMGAIYAHPETVMRETMLGPLPDDPKVEVQVDGAMVCADMGGLLRGYSGLQMASVHFIPKDPTKTVQITFSEWGFGQKDLLNLYATDLMSPFNYKGATVSHELMGEGDGTPFTILSQAKDGGIYMVFLAEKGGDASKKRGWKATVQEVPKMNYLTLAPITVASHYPEGEAEIKIKVKNHTGVEQTKVDGEMKIEGENEPVRFEIPSIAANQELEYTIPSKVKVPYPWLGTISVTVYGSDTDLSDNKQKVTIRNDKFWYGGTLNDSRNQGLLKADVAPSKVNFLGVTNDTVLTYHMDKKLTFYTGTVNPLHVLLQKEVKEENLPATLHVWIDVDESDGELKNVAPEYYSVALEKGKTEFPLDIDLAGQQPGERRMRIAVLPGGEAERDQFIKGEKLPWGRAVDITAVIKEGANPAVNDLGVRLFAKISSGANLGKQEVSLTIDNHGHAAASNFEIKLLVNGEEKVKETVTQTIPPFDGSLLYTFSEKVDLSEVGKEYQLMVQLPDDGVMENNTVEQRVVSLPEQATDKLYALDFKRVKGECVDYAPLTFKYKNKATLEGWFFLRKQQNALLFKADGLLVVATPNTGDLPHNAVAVLSGDSQLDVTEAGMLMPGQFHHVAITFETVGFFISKSTIVKVYIDGKAVPMRKRQGGWVPDFAHLTQAMQLDGQVKMMRVWDKVLTESQIASQMGKSIRDGVSGKLPSGCIAEYLMNEGAYGYIASGSDLAKLVSDRVDSQDENIWVNLADRLVGGVSFEGQVIPSKLEDDGTISFLMPHGYDATQPLKGQIVTLWPDTKLEYEGAEVDASTEFDFSNASNEIALRASVTMFGVTMQQDVKVRLVLDKQDGTKIVKVNLLASDNNGLKSDVRVVSPGQTIRLEGVEEVTAGSFADMSKCVLELEELSPAATVHYKDQAVGQGGKLLIDLTEPAIVKVLAENQRDFQLYTVQIVKPQTIQWETSDLSYVFAATTVQMDAKSSAPGVPIVYRSKDEHVVTIDGEGRLRIGGVGETEITALAAASGVYAAAAPVSRKVKVTPAALTVRPSAMEMEEGGEAPSVELEFDGLQFNEKELMFQPIEYAIYRDAATVWTPAVGTLGEGEYEVKPLHYTDPYADGNYVVTLASGKLVVKPSLKNKRVTFVVVDVSGGAALVGAKVEIQGMTLSTGSEGKVSVTLAPAAYSYSVVMDGYAVGTGEVTVADVDQEVKVELKKLEVLLAYATDGNGVIGLGAAKQRLPKGGTGEKVVAVPNQGYRFANWEDGNTAAERQDSEVQADAVHTASFEPITYALEYAVAEGGEFADGTTAKKSQKVTPGQAGTEVEVRAKAGYFFAGWSDGVSTLKRKDTPTGDRSVEAKFYKAFALPLVENFEQSTLLPFAWLVENNSTSTKYALWRVGKDKRYNTNTGRCAYVNCDDSPDFAAKTDAGLLTPWIAIANLDGDLEISFTFYLSVYAALRVQAQLEYRTEESVTAWKTLKKYGETPKGTLVKEGLEMSQLVGKEYVQFRWVYRAGFDAGIAVDNISVGVKGKATIVYVAGEGGKVTTKPNDPSAAAKELTVTTVPGTLGDEVTAVPDGGYRFDRWDDLKKEKARRDDANGRYTALFLKDSKTFTLVYTSSSEGTLRGLNFQKVKEGSNGVPITAVANAGYRFVKWSDGSTDNPRTDEAVQENIEVTAHYAKTCKLEVLSVLADGSAFDEGGATVTDATTQEELQKVYAGQQIAVEAKSVKGYDASVQVEGATLGADGVYVVSDDVKVTVTYTVQPQTATLTFVVKEAAGAVQGAKVMVDGVPDPQMTDADGVAKFEKLAIGNQYSYTVSKEGYKEAKGAVKLDGDATQEVTLEKEMPQPQTVTLTFVVKEAAGAVQGAKVMVDGVADPQMTNADGVAKFEKLAIGNQYSYTVSKEGYKEAKGAVTLNGDATQEVMLEPGSTPVESLVLREVTLRPNPAKTILLVEHAEAVERMSVVSLGGATLLRHDNVAGEATVRIAVEGLAEGMYLLRVEAEGTTRVIPFAVER